MCGGLNLIAIVTIMYCFLKPLCVVVYNPTVTFSQVLRFSRVLLNMLMSLNCRHSTLLTKLVQVEESACALIC